MKIGNVKKSVLAAAVAACAAFAAVVADTSETEETNETAEVSTEQLLLRLDSLRQSIERARAAFGGRASTNEDFATSSKLVSRALLDKRVSEAKEDMCEVTAQVVYEASTNLDAKITSLRRLVAQNVEEDAEEADREQARRAQNQKVWSRAVSYALAGEGVFETQCTNTAIVTTAATDSRLGGVFLVWDRDVRGNYVTNALYGISNYSIKDAQTGDVTYRFYTEDGEVYDSIPGVETNEYRCVIHTTVCTTNESRVIKFRAMLLDDYSYDIIMGRGQQE